MITQPRRTFIKRSAMFAVAAPFISTAVTRALAQAAEPKINFALCGLGSLSTNQIAPALQKTKNCKLAGLITGTPAKAETWKAKYNIPDKNIYNYDTMHNLADNPDIDVVYVVTPNALHGELTIKAAKAGKHVLCEKPMEVSPEKCQQMVDACKAADRLLAIGYRCHFEPNHLECVRLAREKVFGELKIIEAGFGFAIGDPTQWRLNHDLSGGGALMDVGIYALQTTRYITGEEPISITAAETKTDPVKFKSVDESIVWTTKFPSGVIAYCSTTFKVAGINRFTAYAEKGWYGLNPAYGYTNNKGLKSDRTEINMPPNDQFADEMDNFAECIRAKRKSTVSGEEGLRDVKILMSIYEAARTGREVKLA